jgi:diguanylate cyclase (GGDEF)-like protein
MARRAGGAEAARGLSPECLKGIGIFSSLGDADRKEIYGRMRARSLEKGETLFLEGDPGDELYALVSGKVRVSVKPAEGERIILAELGPGAFFGEMAIIDKSPRSASCEAAEASVLLSLSSSDFDALVDEKPEAAIGVLDAMLEISTSRLMRTGAFLQEMVQFGEAARTRAITDPMTGLFNRRYMEEAFEGLVEKSISGGGSLSLVMFDLDRFGSLNARYGQEFGDRAIVEAAKAMRRVYGERDVLIRYGGDEFVFLLEGSGPAEAKAWCEALCREFRQIRMEGHEDLVLTCSMGYASLPAHAESGEALKALADKALYRAKELGRDRAEGPESIEAEVAMAAESEQCKESFQSIAARNRVIKAIIQAIDSGSSFLMVGHANPDEDCLAAMVSFALIVRKLGKRASVLVGGHVQEQLSFLLDIACYNSIEVLKGPQASLGDYDAVVAMDTPKPSMIERFPALDAFLARAGIVKIEFDHHLEADSRYFGDPGYRYVTESSSTCELIGFLAIKLSKDAALNERYQLDDLFSRNLVLSILTGIVGDSQMGKFLKTKRERWFYEWLSGVFEGMLRDKTYKSGRNFKSKEEVFSAIASLSKAEEKCSRELLSKTVSRPFVKCIVLNEAESNRLFKQYGEEAVIAVAKSCADVLAEESGYLSLVAYYDPPGKSGLVQMRMRRSQSFSGLDLREMLAELKVENGGGHPGAVGFRFDKASVADVEEKAAEFTGYVERKLKGTIASPPPAAPSTKPEMAFRLESEAVSAKALEAALGPAYPAYERFIATISAEPLSLVHTWRYYRDSKAWLCKIARKGKTVSWLSAWKGFFKVSTYFSPRQAAGFEKLPISPQTIEAFKAAALEKKNPCATLDIAREEQLEELLAIMRFKAGKL